VATRGEQVVILTGMLSKISDALGVASVFQRNTARLIEGVALTQITLTRDQKDGFETIFDAAVANVKADGASL